MAYNDAPSAKVPPFPDQFQAIGEPLCNLTSMRSLKAHIAGETLLNTIVAVKGKQIGDDPVSMRDFGCGTLKWRRRISAIPKEA